MAHAHSPPAGTRAALVARIDALLPQTQCAKCGHPGCEPYARALASGAAEINQCPPGGDTLIRKLAELLGHDYVPLDPARGSEHARHVAYIDEPRCIGCTLCIQACPVDAIVGAAQQVHTVIVELCTGCDLCVAPCPVDCIAMVPATGTDARWDQPRIDAARERFVRRNRRLARDAAESAARQAPRKAAGTVTQPLSREQKRATIRAAVERVRARRAAARRFSS
ncbi:MAG: electron transport complex subunit RsxB [Burkholderiales bacterium]